MVLHQCKAVENLSNLMSELFNVYQVRSGKIDVESSDVVRGILKGKSGCFLATVLLAFEKPYQSMSLKGFCCVATCATTNSSFQCREIVRMTRPTTFKSRYHHGACPHTNNFLVRPESRLSRPVCFADPKWRRLLKVEKKSQNGFRSKALLKLILSLGFVSVRIAI